MHPLADPQAIALIRAIAKEIASKVVADVIDQIYVYHRKRTDDANYEAPHLRTLELIERYALDIHSDAWMDIDDAEHKLARSNPR